MLAVARVRPIVLCMLLAAMVLATHARADTVAVAVATNFAEPAASLGASFAASTGHRLAISSGASGALYAQIKAGAPFDVLLSADAVRPADLEHEGAGVAGTRFTYALGRLALWSLDAARIGADPAKVLAAADYRALAIADPALAPYGLAARQTLTRLGLWDSVRERLVYGKNIGQTHALVATGNAELGFVALSALRSTKAAEAEAAGSLWIVPADMHEAIRQDAILLAAAADKPAARAFMAFLRSEPARAIITSFGYAVDQ